MSINESAPLVVHNEHQQIGESFKAAVFGFSDGLTTSMNLVLGVALTRQSHAVVVFTGLAGMFAGASSMACGEWLSARAENDSQRRELEREADHLRTIPAEEAAHMKQILLQYGLGPRTADAVNADIAALPLERQVTFHGKFELGGMVWLHGEFDAGFNEPDFLSTRATVSLATRTPAAQNPTALSPTMHAPMAAWQYPAAANYSHQLKSLVRNLRADTGLQVPFAAALMRIFHASWSKDHPPHNVRVVNDGIRAAASALGCKKIVQHQSQGCTGPVAGL